MTDQAITALIKEVLAEELERIRSERGGARPSDGRQEERVVVASDADLQAFACRVLKIGDDQKSRRDIEEGKMVFRLAGYTSEREDGATHQFAATNSAETQQIDSGVVSERQVNGLPKGTKRLRLGKQVRLTPLARDRLRQRGIEIERTG